MTDFDKVRAILDAATPGPWDTYDDDGIYIPTTVPASGRIRWDNGIYSDRPEADARAIVVARNLAPELLAVAEAAERYWAAWNTGESEWHNEHGMLEASDLLCDALDALHAKMRETL